ncbi:MAG: hypothetical protein EOP74_00190 [Variovorax sp.]|nr:MAG: hypothetical protein EOP74_00190 [Variovorax sp.]
MEANKEVHNRELARSLGCITDSEFRSLANITESTEEAWRKRGTGPAFIRLGKSYLYPLSGLKDHLDSLTKTRNATPMRGTL